MINEAINLTPADSPRYYRTVSVRHCTRQEVCLALTDKRGRTLSLGNKEIIKNEVCPDNDCDNGLSNPNPDFPDGVVPKDNWPDMHIRLVARPSYSGPILFDIKGTVTDYEKAQVVFHITENESRATGMYLAEVGLFRGDTLLQSWPLYVVVEPTLFANAEYKQDEGNITLPELRLLIRDQMPEDNYLLNEREFSDVEIMAALRRPVDYWNGALPIDPALHLAYNGVPSVYRHFFIQGTLGYLLEIAASDYRRNSMPTQAGGIALNERERWQQYDARARELLQEFQVWVGNVKYGLSMQAACGIVGSYF